MLELSPRWLLLHTPCHETPDHEPDPTCAVSHRGEQKGEGEVIYTPQEIHICKVGWNVIILTTPHWLTINEKKCIVLPQSCSALPSIASAEHLSSWHVSLFFVAHICWGWMIDGSVRQMMGPWHEIHLDKLTNLVNKTKYASYWI